ncbi:CPBP family glutamic-type intramembrane protease [Latilactobacillus curvatus]|uniref:CPBP family glutamic-type intramembrane protease n=1 Tax=Latilactobacillus curvatus TaxID=28038 RepID=UPI0036F23B63
MVNTILREADLFCPNSVGLILQSTIYCSFGWILGSTYFWTKDIRCSIVLHMLVNLFLIAHCR